MCAKKYEFIVELKGGYNWKKTWKNTLCYFDGNFQKRHLKRNGGSNKQQLSSTLDTQWYSFSCCISSWWSSHFIIVTCYSSMSEFNILPFWNMEQLHITCEIGVMEQLSRTYRLPIGWFPCAPKYSHLWLSKSRVHFFYMTVLSLAPQPSNHFQSVVVVHCLNRWTPSLLLNIYLFMIFQKNISYHFVKEPSYLQNYDQFILYQ